MARMPGVPFHPPASYSTGRPLGPPRYITLHYTAGHEGPNDAENGAHYDTIRTDGTSTHFHVDSDSIVQCVDTAHRAHTALYHGNAWGIHIEIAGTRQTRAQWLDAVSRPTIRQCARVCAWAMGAHDIPLVRLPTDAVRSATVRGFVDHADWTHGWPEDNGTHEDVGPEFPWDVLFTDIATELGGTTMVDETNVTEEGIWSVLDKGLRGGNETSQQPKPGGGTWSRPNNWLVRRLLELEEQAAANAASLVSLHLKVDAIAVAAGDPNAIAAAVATELSTRLTG